METIVISIWTAVIICACIYVGLILGKRKEKRFRNKELIRHLENIASLLNRITYEGERLPFFASVDTKDLEDPKLVLDSRAVKKIANTINDLPSNRIRRDVKSEMMRNGEFRIRAVDMLNIDCFNVWYEKDPETLYSIVNSVIHEGWDMNITDKQWPFKLLVFTKEPFDVVAQGTIDHVSKIIDETYN